MEDYHISVAIQEILTPMYIINKYNKGMDSPMNKPLYAANILQWMEAAKVGVGKREVTLGLF